jgi:uncharacterized membrane protein YGL010W
VVIGIVKDSWLWVILAIVLVVAGYALQFIGHHIEGNDAGETILVKKLLGKPYIAVVEKKTNTDRDKKSL